MRYGRSLLVGSILVSSAGSCGPPPPPPPAQAPSWCEQVRGVLPNDRFQCSEVPGWVEIGYFGSADNPNSSTFGGCIADAGDRQVFRSAVVRETEPLESFHIKTESRRHRGGGANLDFTMFGDWAKKWLPSTAVKAESAGSFTVDIEFRDVKLQKLSDVPREIAARLTGQYEQGSGPWTRLQGCQQQLCRDGTMWTAAVVVGVPTVNIAREGSREIGLTVDPAKLGDFQVGDSSSTQGKLTLVGKKPLALAGLLVAAKGEMEGAGACVQPRPLDDTQSSTYRGAVKTYAAAILGSYPCLWLKVATEVANRACGSGTPCNLFQVMELYRKPLREFTAEERAHFCEGVQAALEPMTGSDLTVECNTVTAWFDFHKDRSFCSRPMSGCDDPNDILGSHFLQVGLMSDLVNRIGDDQARAQFRSRLMDAWASLAPGIDLEKSGDAWSSLRTACGPAGCLVPFRGRQLPTGMPWSQVRGLLFQEWLGFFAKANAPTYVNSCSQRMCFDGSQWTFGGRRGRCLSWSNPEQGLDVAADAFTGFVAR